MAASSSSVNRKIRVADEAYLLVGLHASKYPDSPVLGYLIGSQTNDQFDVSEVLPVGHNVPAGPILEIAAEVAENVAGSSKIIGFYYGVEFAQSGPPPSYIERIISNLKTILGQHTIVLQIKTQHLADSKHLFVEGSLVNGTPVKTETVSATGDIHEKFVNAYAAQQQLLVLDFEDHMNSDSVADFRNQELIRALRAL